LPVQASVLVSSLIHKFKPEFDAQLSNPGLKAEPFATPLMADFDGQNHRFVYDDRIALKNPDWTYGVPTTVEEPVPLWRHIDFRHEIDRLESSEFWKTEDRTAKTLVKEGNFSVVLTLMKTGAVLKEHQAEGNVSIQVLHGRIRLNLDQDTLELNEGEMMILNPGVRHSVEALDETAFVMNIMKSVARS